MGAALLLPALYMWETEDIRSKGSRNPWYAVHMTEPVSISTFVKSAAT
jgi:hypothetical protein